MGRWNVSVTSVSTAYNSELVYGAAVGHQLAVSCESGATTAVSRLRGHLFQFGEILSRVEVLASLVAWARFVIYPRIPCRHAES